MLSLENTTVSFEEGSASDAVNASTSQASGQELSSADEEPSVASVDYSVGTFAFDTAPNVTDSDGDSPNNIAEGMQHPDRKAALPTECDGRIVKDIFTDVDSHLDILIMQSFMLQSNKYEERGSFKLCKARQWFLLMKDLYAECLRAKLQLFQGAISLTLLEKC